MFFFSIMSCYSFFFFIIISEFVMMMTQKWRKEVWIQLWISHIASIIICFSTMFVLLIIKWDEKGVRWNKLLYSEMYDRTNTLWIVIHFGKIFFKWLSKLYEDVWAVNGIHNYGVYKIIKGYLSYLFIISIVARWLFMSFFYLNKYFTHLYF